MKRLLNTLYVTVEGAYLAKEGETVLVRIEQDRITSYNVCYTKLLRSPCSGLSFLLD